PTADLGLLAELLAGSQLDPTGESVPLTREEFHNAWQKLTASYPRQFGATPAEVTAWYRRQAEQCLLRYHWAEAVAYLDHLLERQAARAQDWVDRGRGHAQLRHWDQAVADYLRALALRPTEFDWWIDLGLLYLACGDTAAYGRICADLLERVDHSDDP